MASFQVGDSVNLGRALKRLCITGRMSEAVGLLWRSGVQVGHGTYTLLLQECVFGKMYGCGRRIHAQMVVTGHVPNVYLQNKLLILYAKSGDLATARVLFDRLAEKSIVSWNALIAGHVQNGVEDVGLGLYDEMRRTCVVPDQFTFSSVFRACAALAVLEYGKKAHGVFMKLCLRENVVVSSALMDMYFKCCDLYAGRRVFDEADCKNVVTWTSLIHGYGLHGRTAQVFESFHQMKDEGLRPNDVTFLAVISACSHGGLVEEGREYFLSMERDYRIKPRPQHYAAVVDLLGRSGRVQEAFEFALTSPYKAHSVVWGSLLGACRIHGNIDQLKLATERYFELDAENAGKHVVVSNILATFGLWENVAEVREWMKDSGIKKEPACSWIQVQGENYIFLTGDKTHKQSDQIYRTVIEMSCHLVDASLLT